MKLNVIIRNISEPRDWRSDATGRSGVSRTVILSPSDDPDSFLCAVASEEVWHPLGLRVGDTACLPIRFRTKTYRSSGFVATDIRITENGE